ncbi:hypothetical protein CSBG_03325 [Clostridium sp. 7_2_43FAA]|jgi:hypothetical protein|uniref:DUF960 family protein n=1 Tax=Clostridium TaxID=1485 RepID=UPI00019B084A|nr:MULTISPECIES: DUF960 family protein [Clostridium]EEH99699.1 hypothetical protein CSBG_03325 [Clostridium sp. 7_2_43FAA]
MFKKDNRYVTRGVNEEVDVRLQLIMWSMIDKLKDEGNVELDYLQIFRIRKEKTFDYDSKELLGVMRFDFYDRVLANQWNSKNLIIELNDRKEIDLKKLQEELNYIQFTLIKDFSKVVELCNGTGYDKETLVYIELEEGKYVVKLIPVLDSYSYIYTYKR